MFWEFFPVMMLFWEMLSQSWHGVRNVVPTLCASFSTGLSLIHVYAIALCFYVLCSPLSPNSLTAIITLLYAVIFPSSFKKLSFAGAVMCMLIPSYGLILCMLLFHFVKSWSKQMQISWKSGFYLFHADLSTFFFNFTISFCHFIFFILSVFCGHN